MWQTQNKVYKAGQPISKHGWALYWWLENSPHMKGDKTKLNRGHVWQEGRHKGRGYDFG